MADVMDYQDVYRRLGDMQSKVDDLFLQAVESSEFRSASIIIRLNVGLERNVENVDVLSQEYRNSDFAKKAGQLGKTLVPEESVDSRSLRVRFIWSDAYELLGNSALSPISDSVVSKLYVGSVIRRRYESSVQDMFQRMDRSSGSSASGNILVDLQIEKDGKVSQATMVDASLSGSAIEKSVQDLVKSWSFPGVKSQLKVRAVLARVNPLMSSSSESAHPSQIWIDGVGWVSAHVLMNLSSQNWGSSMSSSQMCQVLSFDGRPMSVPCDQLSQFQSSSSSQRCPTYVPGVGWISLPCDQVMQASSSSSQNCFRVLQNGSVISVPCDQTMQASSSSQMCTAVLPNGSTISIPCQIMQSSSQSSSQTCPTYIQGIGWVSLPCSQQMQSSSSSQWCRVTLPDGSSRFMPCDQVMQSSSSSQNCFRRLPDGSIISVPCGSIQSSSSSQWCQVTLPNGSSTFVPCSQIMQASSSSSSSQWCTARLQNGSTIIYPCDQNTGVQSSSSSSQWCLVTSTDGRTSVVPCSQIMQASSSSSSSQWCRVTLPDGSSRFMPCDQVMQSSSSSQNCFRRLPDGSIISVPCGSIQSASSQWCQVTLPNGSSTFVPCSQIMQASSSSSQNCFRRMADGSIISVPCSSIQSAAPSQNCFQRMSDGSLISVPCDQVLQSSSASQMIPGQPYPFPGGTYGSSGSDTSRVQAASASTSPSMVYIPGIGQVSTDVLNNAARMQSAYQTINPNVVSQFIRPGGVATEMVAFPCREPFCWPNWLHWPYGGVATEMVAFPDRLPYISFPMNPVIQQAQQGQVSPIQAASASTSPSMVNIPGIGQVSTDVLNNAARMQSAYQTINPNAVSQFLRPGGVANEMIPFPCRQPLGWPNWLHYPYCGVATEMVAFPDRMPYIPFPMNPVIQQAQQGQVYNPNLQPQVPIQPSNQVIR